MGTYKADKPHDLLTRLGYPTVERTAEIDLTVLREKLREFLATLKDGATSIDSGGGLGSVDLWVTFGGVEYFVAVSRSKGQQQRDQETVTAQSKTEGSA